MKVMILTFVILLCCMYMVDGYALIPVIDTAALAKLADEVSQLQQQYAVLKQALSESKQLVSDNQGNYGMGGIANSSQDFQKRLWSASSWQQVEQGKYGSDADHYHMLWQQYNNAHHFVSQQQYSTDVNADQAQSYADDKNNNQASITQSKNTFDHVQQHMDSIYHLSQYIDKTKNTKQAIDLNNRLLAECAYLQAKNIKMQSIVSMQLAQQNTAKVSALSHAADFNSLNQ